MVIPGRPASMKESVTMTIVARDAAEPPVADAFIENLSKYPAFAKTLRKQGVLLKNRSPRQFDAIDPTKSFRLITVECLYPEKTIRDE